MWQSSVYLKKFFLFNNFVKKASCIEVFTAKLQYAM